MQNYTSKKTYQNWLFNWPVRISDENILTDCQCVKLSWQIFWHIDNQLKLFPIKILTDFCTTTKILNEFLIEIFRQNECDRQVIGTGEWIYDQQFWLTNSIKISVTIVTKIPCVYTYMCVCLCIYISTHTRVIFWKLYV